MKEIHKPVRWINNDLDLNSLCYKLKKEKLVALDTEFVRETTFYPRLSLIQLACSQSIFLIDVLSLSDWSAFAELLRSESVLKVMHACREDLEALYFTTRSFPNNIFDTQLAAAYLGIGFSLSLQKLVKIFINEDLDKSLTRSDWLKRPLTEEQCSYAARDVLYLNGIYEQLHKRLAQYPDKYQWFYEDCSKIKSDIVDSQDLGRSLLQIKRAWQLNSNQLKVLYKLCVWREELARKQDVPRKKIISNSQLWKLAKHLPRDKSELGQYLLAPLVRKRGEDILGILFGESQEDIPCWVGNISRPLKTKLKKLLPPIKHFLLEFTDKNAICTELLLDKSQIKSVILNALENKPSELPSTGWRAKKLQTDLIALINQYQQDN